MQQVDHRIARLARQRVAILDGKIRGRDRRTEAQADHARTHLESGSRQHRASLEQIEGDYASLAQLARANGIRVVFSSVLPINAYTPRAMNFFLQRSPEKILSLNDWLKKYCSENGIVYLDYFSAMVDEHGYLKQDLTEDGLHPNAAGFAIMAPLAQSAITKALGQPVVMGR